MSGFEVIGVILAVYPMVTGLAQTYSSMKPGVGSRQLSRKLETEATIYEKTVKDLLASVLSQEEIQRLVQQESNDQRPWQEQSLRQKLRRRLGREKLTLTIKYLDEMRDLLDALRGELENMCRGTRVLDRFKTKVKAAMATMPLSTLQERLKVLNQLNNDLSRLLDENPVLAPYPQYREEVIFSHQDHGVEAREFYEAIRQVYTCSCAEAHLTNLGCHCDGCIKPMGILEPASSTRGWEFGLAFPRRHDSLTCPRLLSAVVVLEPPSWSDENESGKTLKKSMTTSTQYSVLSEDSIPHGKLDVKGSIIENLCSLVEEVDRCPQAPQQLMDIVGNNKTYRLRVKKLDDNGPGNFRCFAELMQPGNRLSTRDRMELAFRLSFAILQLCKTPWINDSWAWNDVCVSQVEENEGLIKFSIIFIPQEFYSVNRSADNPSKMNNNNTVWSILQDQPVLTKLGFALIELALGQTLEDLKKETKSCLEDDSQLDDNTLNFITAKRLLKTGKIRQEAMKDYEDVVKACIAQQYRDKDGINKALLLTDESFLRDVKEAIISPLFHVWKKFEECG